MKEGQTQEPVGGMKWIDVNDQLPIEEKYYHTKGSDMCCYWHSDTKKFDLKGVTHWLDENYTPPPSPVGIDVKELANRIKQLEKAIQWALDNPGSCFVFNELQKTLKAGYSASLPQSSTSEEERKDQIEMWMIIANLFHDNFSNNYYPIISIKELIKTYKISKR